MSHAEGSASPTGSRRNNHGIQQPDFESSQSTFAQAWHRRKIAELEEKIESLKSGRAVKKRQTNYYLAQGRGFRRIVALFDGVEDLVSENDRRYDLEDDHDHDAATIDQDRLAEGYNVLTRTLPWFLKTVTDMEHDEQGADGARGDDTSKLKTLISDWVNRELKPDPPVDHDDKNCHGFINEACGRLLCPAELDWNDPAVRTGIRDQSEGYVVTDLSFPSFLYEKYNANSDDLEEGLFKGRILVQGYKAVFTSPSSAKDIDGNGDGADIVENNRRVKKALSGITVKKHVVQIIKMDKVTPHSIAYIACQVRFALSSVTSWRSVDGDFDYIQFWQTIVDFFERPPGREAWRRVTRLLEWWTIKVFGRRRREDLSNEAKAAMSINTLARQRADRDDISFNSD
ncbi:uncharacterized protein F5891DRAFT_1193669 [Suillus fuscotomentosus]|uniref:Uncharacterized protein n=1 Tax=Suillus fuscotomentosus TaxID=1912939 RepID=A0AAD4DXE3_9AGAM|nr:uncharacterized protein F5891DRAFT_1193669 [Suillus fuscotomentosus]KAG1895855.1 hypothetical protein F5891DRAFT_1193669 [Suillus fuscotomentosus]